MAKQKVWYKHLKAGDKIVVKLLPGHLWYNRHIDKELTATINSVYWDGCIGCYTDESLSPCLDFHTLNIGFDGTDWERSYPANILRKASLLRTVK
jgi:hypothetical protein